MPSQAKRSFWINHFLILLQILVKANKIPTSLQKEPRYSTAHSLMWQIATLLHSKNSTRKMIVQIAFLPTLLIEIKAMAICEICKIMFTLSLVELFVECELTLNTQFSIENLKEKSLIAQRLWLFICYKTKLKKKIFFF